MRDPAEIPPPQVHTPPPRDAWHAPLWAPLIPRPSRPEPLTKPGRRGWLAGVVATALLLGVYLAPRPSLPFAPLVGAAPSWNVELAAAGARPVTALVYGEEAGLHLVRIPAASAGRSARRVIPARLAQGELYMVSLGWSPLVVRASSPPGTPRMSWSAQGRFVQAFQDERGTGVSTSWR